MNLEKYSKIQNIAKQVIQNLATGICADSSEQSIAIKAKKLLENFGVTETWYHNVPVFVLLGNRSCLSTSGRDYVPATELVGNTNLVTIDLSPCVDNIWGDYARSFVVENGTVISSPKNEAFKEGLKMEKHLHYEMQKYVCPETTFSELFAFGNQFIIEQG